VLETAGKDFLNRGPIPVFKRFSGRGTPPPRGAPSNSYTAAPGGAPAAKRL